MFGMSTFQFSSLLLLLVYIKNNYANIFQSIYLIYIVLYLDSLKTFSHFAWYSQKALFFSYGLERWVVTSRSGFISLAMLHFLHGLFIVVCTSQTDLKYQENMKYNTSDPLPPVFPDPPPPAPPHHPTLPNALP